MTDVVLADEMPVARKHHLCDHCQCSIAPGERYRRMRSIQDGQPCVWKSHLDCEKLAAILWREYNLPWDEGICLCDEERDEIVLWRGDFPHVICRLELGWELAAQQYARWREEDRAASERAP